LIYTDKIATRINNLIFGTYEMLALEYYDSMRHPTCANFRQASFFLLRNWLRHFLLTNELICEVGPAKSLVAELLSQQGCVLDNIILADSSPTMLSYSSHWYHQGVSPILGDAESLPIASGTIAVLVSSLGDPYNNYRFWKEADRVLKRDGFVIFTTPSYEWTSSYRGDNKDAFTSAEFELLDGSYISVPSLVYPVDEQIRLIESSGFALEEVSHIPISALEQVTLSPKIQITQGNDLTVVSGYCAKKKAH